MIPIYLHGPSGDKGYLFKNFSHHLIGICDDHQMHNRASAFVFILHDLTKPALIKALEDPAYWAALDEISGNVLSVFSLHETLIRDLRQSRDDMVRGIRDVVKKSQEIGEQFFGFSDVRTPALLFFQVDNQKIHDFSLIELEAKSPDSIFDELRLILNSCAECLKDSTGKVIRNPQESFERLERKLIQLRVKRKAGGIFKKAIALRELLKNFN